MIVYDLGISMKTIDEVMDQREEILRAFIAKYGYEPDKVMQVEQRMSDGSVRWFVCHKSVPGLIEV